jgi:predicted phage terminase large subunit-like protein
MQAWSPLAREVSNILRRYAPGAARPPAAEVDLVTWGQQFLPPHFSRPPSRMHCWLAEVLQNAHRTRGQRINVIGPRGSAKSTVVTLAYALRMAAERHEPYIWIVSDTRRQAELHLQNIKHEIEANERLAECYPRSVARGGRWQASAIELVGGTVIEAYGTGQKIRGRRRRADRPTLIVCDDLENDSHARSATARQASRQWFESALLHAGTKSTNIINLATALHRDALAVRLGERAGWLSRTFRAIEQWPANLELWDQWQQIYTNIDNPAAMDEAEQFYEQHRSRLHEGVEDLLSLMKMRAEVGVTSFEREKQGRPIDADGCEWPDHYFGDTIWFDDWPDELPLRVVALDPSKGASSRHGDYSAYVLLGVDAGGTLFVDADLQRRPTPQMVAEGLRHCRQFAPQTLGVEVNQWQELLADQFVQGLAAEGLTDIRLCTIANYTSKQVRIRRIAPYLALGGIRFRRHSPGAQLLVEQLRDFPLGTHDDGPDALEMAIRLAEQQTTSAVADRLGDRLPIDA